MRFVSILLLFQTYRSNELVDGMNLGWFFYRHRSISAPAACALKSLGGIESPRGFVELTRLQSRFLPRETRGAVWWLQCETCPRIVFPEGKKYGKTCQKMLDSINVFTYDVAIIWKLTQWIQHVRKFNRFAAKVWMNRWTNIFQSNYPLVI